jgi:hypothetical protein
LCFYLNFWVVVEVFFFKIVFACSLLHCFCVLLSFLFVFGLASLFFTSFFFCVCLCFCFVLFFGSYKFFVCIYFTTVSRFQFASSLHLVKDLTLHMWLVKRSRSCLKEGKLQKSKVCPFDFNNATSNLGSSKSRFFFSSLWSWKIGNFFHFLGNFLSNLHESFFDSIFSNSFYCHYVKICPKRKYYLKLFVKWNEIQFHIFLQVSLMWCIWWIDKSCHYWLLLLFCWFKLYKSYLWCHN